MRNENRVVDVLFFCVKFAAFAAVCLPLWWTVMPAYVWLLGHVSAFALRLAAGVAIDSIAVKPEGILNTGITLAYVVEGRYRILDVARLVTNVAPFVALVLATPRIAWLKRLRILGIGMAILSAGHAAYLILACAFYQTIIQNPAFAQSVIAIGEYTVMTLPFLLWAALAYWDRLSALLAAAAPATHNANAKS